MLPRANKRIKAPSSSFPQGFEDVEFVKSFDYSRDFGATKLVEALQPSTGQNEMPLQIQTGDHTFTVASVNRVWGLEPFLSIFTPPRYTNRDHVVIKVNAPRPVKVYSLM